MNELKFSYNWNSKLDNKCFTSIRLSDTHKIGNEYKVVLKQGKSFIPKGVAKVIDMREFMLEQLNPFVSHIDTGYSVDETKAIVKRMYPKVDFETKKLKLLLLKYTAGCNFRENSFTNENYIANTIKTSESNIRQNDRSKSQNFVTFCIGTEERGTGQLWNNTFIARANGYGKGTASGVSDRLDKVRSRLIGNAVPNVFIKEILKCFK